MFENNTELYSSQKVKSQQLGELVYNKLKNHIIAGKYSMENEISIKNISQKLGVSNTPVREALNKLKNDNLIEKIPYRGYKIKSYSLKQIKDVYETRAVIEGFASKLLAEQINEQEKKSLQNIQTKTIQYFEDNNIEQYHINHQKLHKFIVLKSENETIVKIFDNLFLLISLFVFQTVDIGGRPIKAIKEHNNIIKAITLCKPEKARSLMEKHIIDGMNDYLNKIDNS